MTDIYDDRSVIYEVVNIMDKKLEQRIARLEKFIENKSVKNESVDVNELISVANFFDKASLDASSYLNWLPEELDDDELKEELINFRQAARRCRDILNKDYIYV